MYSSQAKSQQGAHFSGPCGGYRSAHRANKRAKFEAWMQGKANKHHRFMKSATAPSVNIKEQDDQFEIQVFAPGDEKDAFEVSISENILTISGKANPEDQDQRWRRQEHAVQDFERKFELNEKIDPEGISAQYINGVLLVSMKKKPGHERVQQSIMVE